jgi:hypothetical protein
MCYCVVGFIIPEVSESLSAYNFMVKQSKKIFLLGQLDTEDNGIMIL